MVFPGLNPWAVEVLTVARPVILSYSSPELNDNVGPLLTKNESTVVSAPIPIVLGDDILDADSTWNSLYDVVVSPVIL